MVEKPYGYPWHGDLSFSEEKRYHFY
jgi:hypothetical protein